MAAKAKVMHDEPIAFTGPGQVFGSDNGVPVIANLGVGRVSGRLELDVTAITHDGVGAASP